MKKYFHVFLSLTLVLALALGVSAPALAAQGDSAPFTATFSGTRLTVSGDVDDTALKGALALVIAVFETESGNQVAMESCAVAADGTFRYTLSATFAYSTSYTVKLADYAGGSYVSLTAQTGARPAPTPTPVTPPAASDATDSADSTVNVPASDEKGSVKVEVTVTDGSAAVKDISAADIAAAADKDAPVALVIDLSGLDEDVDKATLSNTTMKTIADAAAQEDSGLTGLEVKLSGGTVTMDAKAMDAVLKEAGSQEITVAVEETKPADLTADQQATVGKLTDATVINAYFQAGDKRIGDFGGGNVGLSLSYTATKGTPIVEFLSDAGVLTRIARTYDAEAGALSFKAPHFSYYVMSTLEDPCAGYTDVDEDGWYQAAVENAIVNGLMLGTDDKFTPGGDLSRAMLCQILYNLEGRPAVTAENPFTDVPAGQWYTDAVVWAYENEIVDGYGNGKFGPTDDITREQLAAIIWRYDGKKVSAASLDTFNDAGKISSYAVDALKWAYENGVVSGKGNGILDPLGKAQRCEVAQMLMNYLEK